MKRRHLILPLPTLLALATFARAADTAITWDGSTGNWTDSTHWSLPSGEYPTADNPPGSTYAVTINGGSINLQGTTFSVDTLAMTAGTLSNGTLVLTSGGDISSPSDLRNISLHNLSTGTLTLTGGVSSFQNDGNLTLLNGGSPVASNTGSLTIASGTSGMDDLTNTGALDVGAGATLSIDGLHYDGGTVTVAEAGTLEIRVLYGNAAGGITGNVSITGNASLSQDFTFNGDVTLDSGSSNSAAMEIAGNVSMHALSVRGDVNGKGSLSPSGLFTWYFGTITLSSSTTLAGGANFVGSLVLGSHMIVPQGAIATLSTWNAGTFLEPSVLTLQTGGLLENNGTLVVAAGAGGTFTIRGNAGVPGFINTGSVEVQSGTFDLNVDDAGSTTGTFTVDAGANIQIVGQLNFSADSRVEGDGAVTFVPSQDDVPHAGPAFNGKYDVGSTSIENETVAFNTHAVTDAATVMENAVISGTGSLTVNGAFTFYQGNFTLPCLILNGSGRSSETNLAPHTYINGTATVTLEADFTPLASAITIGNTGNLSLDFESFTTELAASGAIINKGVLSLSGVFEGSKGSFSNPVGLIQNDGTLTVHGLTAFSGTMNFINNGLLIVSFGTFEQGPHVFSSPSATVLIQSGLAELGPITAGTVINSQRGTIMAAGTFGPKVTLQDAGTLDVAQNSTFVLAAPQQSETTGTFYIAPNAALEFAADYDFSSPDGPSIGHVDAPNDGLIIVDPGITLTLPSDAAFAGTIDVYGTLVIAPPLDSADAGLAPNFTVVYEVPEPATVGVLGMGTALLLMRPRRRRGGRAP